MAKDRFKIQELEEHATAIGYICILWADMEAEINNMIRILAFSDHKVSASFCVNIDMREKVQILLAIAFMKKRSDKWYERLEETLKLIDNQLRQERNRSVHDAWMVEQGEVLRQTNKTTLKKPQSFKPVEFSYHQRKPIKASELWRNVDELSNAIVAMRELSLANGSEQLHRLWHASRP